jgi:hypothetical protein
MYQGTVRKAVKQLLASGAMTVCRVPRPRMDGIMTVVSGYRMTARD